MTNFFTSDTHFGHRNIIRYSNRPFSDFAEMDWRIVDNWNKMVSDTDVVYHLGDVAMGDSDRWDEILKSLNGYKVLVVGNHDRIFLGEKERQRAKWDEKYHEWFDEVWDEMSITLSNGTPVTLSHFPYDGDSQHEDRYVKYRPKDDGKILIHGHTHAEWVAKGMDARVSQSAMGTLQIHVGQDAWHYKPVPEAAVVELIELNS